MKNLIFTFLISSFIFPAALSASAETLVGSLPGEAKVDNTGKANYTIPLAVPPGTAGVQPELALAYNSRAENGLLGAGFSLQGLSAIARASADNIHDGLMDGVDFDEYDRLLLDNQRLILISTDKEYGEDGSEYRTEIDSFRKIILHGDMNSPGSWLEVKTRSGLIHEYGRTADAFVEPANTNAAVSWAINRTTDTVGNYMDFVYFKDKANGEHRLERIEYTGNTGAGLMPYNSVKFIYEDRPDVRFRYLYGARYNTTKRLERIEFKVEEVLVYDYRLEYEQTETDVSQLVSVQQFFANGDEVPATVFKWMACESTQRFDSNLNNLYGMLLPSYHLKRGDGVMNFLFLDMTGDGLADAIELKQFNKGALWSGKPYDGLLPNHKYWGFVPYPDYIDFIDGDRGLSAFDLSGRFYDVNGDGFIDYIYNWFDQGGSLGGVYLNDNGAGMHRDAAWTFPCYIQAYADGFSATVDINGDDLVDLMHHCPWHPGTFNPDLAAKWAQNSYTNSRSGWAVAEALRPPFPVWPRARFIDLNGDGLTDMLYRAFPTTAGIHHPEYFSGDCAYLNTGSGWAATPSYKPPYYMFFPTADGGSAGDNFGYEIVDVNGDHLPDFIYHHKMDNGTTAQGAFLNTGRGWASSSDTNYIPPVFLKKGSPESITRVQTRFDPGAELQDVNGDGLADLVYNFENGTAGAYLNTGKGWKWSVAYTPVLNTAVLNSTLYPGTHFADVNGDGLVDHLTDSPDYGGAHTNRTGKTELLKQVITGYRGTNEYSSSTEFFYKPLTDPSIYEKGSGAEYPVKEVVGPMYVVSEMAKDNGYGDRYYTMYTYAHARTHHDRGFLGFQMFESYDPQTQLSQVETLAQDFPLTGMQLKTETFYIPDPEEDPESPGYRELLKQVDNTWLYDKVDVGSTNLDYPLFYYVAKSTEKQWELGDTTAPYSTVTTYNWFDNQNTTPDTPNLVQYTNAFPSEISYGELKKVVVDYGDGHKQISLNSYYTVDEDDWLLGRLEDTAVTHIHSNGTYVVKTAHFDYIASAGLIDVETAEEGTTSELRTDYAYDDFGNILNKVVSGYQAAPRSVQRSVYEAKGRFVAESYNALDHKGTVVTDPVTGQITALTDPNHLTTEWEHDPLGRATLEERADGTQTTTTYGWESGPVFTLPSSPVTNVVDYTVTVQSSGSSPVKVCYDRKGREVRTVTESADGRTVYKDTGYDAVGRVVVTSDPYFAGETPHYAFTTYDALSRPELITAFDGTKTAYGYGGLVNTVTNNSGATDGPEASRNQRTTTWRNAKGQTTKVEDTLGNQLLYEYDAAGNLIATVAGAGGPGAVRTEMEYNLRGNKIRQDDPDMGEWHYTNNALGQLIVQTDANSNRIEYSYDLLGRAVSRTNWVMGITGLEIESVAKWDYDGDTEGDKLGKLRLEEHFDGNGKLINRKRYAYDQFSRPMLELMNYDGKWYYTCVTYDQYSRQESLHRYWRPKGKEGIESNLDPQWNTFVTTNIYNQRGALLEVRDGDGHTWWEADAEAYDEHGRLTQYQYGNGLTNTNSYDPLTGLVIGLGISNNEYPISHYQFQYDRLGNLKQRSQSRLLMTILTETCTYDSLNRLLQVSGVGSQGSCSYDALGNIETRSDVGTYLYGGTRPHAVASVSSASSAVDYYYDNNGNIVRRDRDGQYEFTAKWNSFNKPKSIFSGTDGSEFEYSVDGTRTKQIIFDDLTNITKKVYATPAYEMFETLTNPAETNRASWVWEMETCRIYVDTPAGRIGIYQEEGSTNGVGSVSRSYLHKDHLGSIVAVSDDSTNVTFISFDAWGNRRNPDDWSPLSQSEIGNHQSSMATDRGFTGHEHLDHVGLVHMNGRIYDPVIGRMISADPTIPRPFDLQSFNRYSYVNNGPLRYTDPSGFSLYEALQGTRYGGNYGRLNASPIQSYVLSQMDELSIATTDKKIYNDRYGYNIESSNSGSSGTDKKKKDDSRLSEQVDHGVTASDVSVPQAPIVQNANNHSPLGILGRVAGGTLGTVGNVISAPWNWLARQSGRSVDSPEVRLKDGSITSRLPPSGRIGTEGIGGNYDALYDKKLGYDAWIHNRSHGKLWDIVETGMELIAGPGKWSRETAALLNEAARGGGIYDFVSHSQGGVQLGQSLGLMTERFAPGSTVSFQNTPYNPFSAYAAGRHAGLSVDYDANPFDMVPALGNPWYLPSAGLYLPVYIGTGAKMHGEKINGTSVWD